MVMAVVVVEEEERERAEVISIRGRINTEVNKTNIIMSALTIDPHNTNISKKKVEDGEEDGREEGEEEDGMVEEEVEEVEEEMNEEVEEATVIGIQVLQLTLIML